MERRLEPGGRPGGFDLVIVPNVLPFGAHVCRFCNFRKRHVIRQRNQIVFIIKDGQVNDNHDLVL